MAVMIGQKLIGVGRSNNPDPREAGAEAARRAADMLNHAEDPAWVLLFCGGKHDPTAVLAGLRGVVGPLPVVGGSAAGTVTSAGLGYSGFEVAVETKLATADEGPRPDTSPEALARLKPVFAAERCSVTRSWAPATAAAGAG